MKLSLVGVDGTLPIDSSKARILAVAPRAALCEQPRCPCGSGDMGLLVPEGTVGCAVGCPRASLEAAGGGEGTCCRASEPWCDFPLFLQQLINSLHM